MGLWTPQLLHGEPPSALIGVKRESPERNPHPATPEFRLPSNSCSLKSLPGPPKREWENFLPGNTAPAGTQLPSLTFRARACFSLAVGGKGGTTWLTCGFQAQKAVRNSSTCTGRYRPPTGTEAPRDPSQTQAAWHHSLGAHLPLGPMDLALPRQTLPCRSWKYPARPLWSGGLSESLSCLLGQFGRSCVLRAPVGDPCELQAMWTSPWQAGKLQGLLLLADGGRGTFT